MFNFFKKNKEYKLADIKTPNINLDKLKEQTKIAAIDDNGFIALNNLKNLGFKITEFQDISSLDIIADYPVIICDIKGVGKSFGADSEGAFLIHEIKRKYPDKYIIAYSTASFGIKNTKFLQKADVSLQKETTTEQWSEVLEKALKEVSNPKIRWKKIRQSLLDYDIELSDLMLLEQSYIRAVLLNNINEMPSNSELPDILDSELMIDIVKDFISGSLVEVLKYYFSGGN
mgnify:CR=1 FL=1|jgi:hypothetical protein